MILICPWCKSETDIKEIKPNVDKWTCVGMPCSNIKLVCGHGPFSFNPLGTPQKTDEIYRRCDNVDKKHNTGI